MGNASSSIRNCCQKTTRDNTTVDLKQHDTRMGVSTYKESIDHDKSKAVACRLRKQSTSFNQQPNRRSYYLFSVMKNDEFAGCINQNVNSTINPYLTNVEIMKSSRSDQQGEVNIFKNINLTLEVSITNSCSTIQHNSHDPPHKLFNSGLIKLQLGDNDILFLHSALSKVLPNFELDEMPEVIQVLIHYSIGRDRVIVDHHDSLACLYIIKNGKIGLFHGEALIDVYMSGESVGDVAFAKNDNNTIEKYPNGWSYKSIQASEIYIISTHQLRLIHAQFIKNKYDFYYRVVNEIPYIKALDEINKKALSENMIEVEEKKGTVLQLSEGPVENVYYVKSGTVRVLYRNSEKLFKEGQCINKEILIFDIMKKNQIDVASDKASLIAISKEMLLRFFGKEFRNSILFACFYLTIHSNEVIYQVLNRYAKLDSGIQNQVKQFHISNENDVMKRRLGSPARPSQEIKINLIDLSCNNSSKSVFPKKNNESTQANYSLSVFIPFDKTKDKNSSDSIREVSRRGSSTYKVYSSNQIEMKQLYNKFKLIEYPKDSIILIKNDQCLILISGMIIEKISQRKFAEFNIISTIGDNTNE